MIGRRQFLAFGATALATSATFPSRLLASSGSVRSIDLLASHSEERVTIDYWADGWYDPDALARINSLMRDRRSGDVAPIDPGLIDVLHALQTATGTGEPLHVVCGYRSAATNAALARTHRGVARNSYHVKAQAADIRLPGYKLRGLRDLARDLKAGGVGYYGRSGFIHVDTGPVRTWS
ncbi:MAG: YcbK family protein [Inquilinaceae bacterium]